LDLQTSDKVQRQILSLSNDPKKHATIETGDSVYFPCRSLAQEAGGVLSDKLWGLMIVLIGLLVLDERCNGVIFKR
jgi:hypothetical protein